MNRCAILFAIAQMDVVNIAICRKSATKNDFQSTISFLASMAGRNHRDNLALSCLRCNLFKGTNLSGIDPESKHVVPLFNPRKDDWIEHFRFDGAKVRGLTEIGRATVVVMNMNGPERIELRQAVKQEGMLE